MRELQMRNAKKAAQNVKEEEKKQLKKHKEEQANKFIESINNNENNMIEMIKNKLMDKTEEEIKQIAINSFKNVSAKTINGVVNAIMNKINELIKPIETTSNNEKEENKMNILKQCTLKDGYYEDGLTVKLIKQKEELFKVLYFIHCEGRYMEYGQYKTYSEALNDYENIIVTYC